MTTPYKYPELYGELAKQGRTKKELAQALRLSVAGLSYKQSKGDFSGDEMRRAAEYLGQPAAKLFDLGQSVDSAHVS